MALATLLVLLLTGARARALIPSIMESVELLTQSSTVIVRGQVVEIRALPDATLANDVVTVRVSEAIKGPAGPTVTFLAEVQHVGEWGDGEHLFFLMPTRNHRSGPLSRTAPATASQYPLAMADLWQRQPVPLDGPLTTPMYDASLRPIQSGRAILDAVRREVANPPTPPRRSIELYISPRSRFFSRSAVNLDGTFLLPFDDRAAATARAWLTSPDPADRINGAHVLSYFKSPENTSVLTGLLNDPFIADGFWQFTNGWYGEGKWAGWMYPVRRIAYAALRDWGAPVPQTWVLRELKYPETRFPQWIVPALAGATLVLFVLIAVLIWAAPRRGRRVAALSVLLLAACAALWLRGVWRIDELAFTIGRNRYELAASDGRLRLMRLHDFTDPAPPAFTTVARTPEAEIDWGFGARPTFEVERRYGFTLERATVHIANATVPVVSGSIRLSRLCAAFACPSLLLAGAARFRRYRKAVQRCPTCGYDLRATPEGCPECGWGRKAG